MNKPIRHVTDWSQFPPPWNTLGPEIARELRRVAMSCRSTGYTKPHKVGPLPEPHYLKQINGYGNSRYLV